MAGNIEPIGQNKPIEREQQVGGLRLIRNVFVKALALFLLINVIFYFAQPMRVLDRTTVYNTLVPGRLRLPFSEYPDVSYSLIMDHLNQMVASHEVAGLKAPDEFRVVLLGDSSVWGYLLDPNQTQAGCLNDFGLTVPSGPRAGEKVHFYNLGYPTLSVMKDLLILRHTLRYKPDLIVWSTTLAALYPSDQLGFEVIEAQYDEVAALQAQYNFKLYQWPLQAPEWWERTLIGQRRALADWLRYQLYGLGWAATGIDHVVPKFVTPHPVELGSSDQMLLVEPMIMHVGADHKFLPTDLSFDIVRAGIQMAGDQGIPVLVVNEPMYRSDTNQVRWNFYYPRWAYDSYREIFRDTAAREGWHYADFWDAMPNDQFTDTDFHLTPGATCTYANKLADAALAIPGSK